LRFIDLFAGCGGLSEGFVSEGFKPVAHIEMDKSACKTLLTRTAFHYLSQHSKLDDYTNYLKGILSWQEMMYIVPEWLTKSVICSKIDETSINEIMQTIDELLKGEPVDVIIGGPPCQAYSLVGRSRDANKMVNDPRNYLFRHYYDFVKRFNPHYIVLENVPGLKTASNHLESIINMFEEGLGYKTTLLTLDASNYGVLQKRKRIVVIGSKNYNTDIQLKEFKQDGIGEILKDLFSDLPVLHPGEAIDQAEYTGDSTQYLTTFGYRINSSFVTQNTCRPHNPRDLEIYRRAIEKWLSTGKRIRYNELPENLITHRNTSSFLDRFKVVDPTGLSHTMVAHISKDGHHYIYPSLSQVRSISVREAARIQSFPDNYYFEGGRTAAFKQIGNAVPPLLAKAVAQAIKANLSIQSNF